MSQSKSLFVLFIFISNFAFAKEKSTPPKAEPKRAPAAARIDQLGFEKDLVAWVKDNRDKLLNQKFCVAIVDRFPSRQGERYDLDLTCRVGFYEPLRFVSRDIGSDGPAMVYLATREVMSSVRFGLDQISDVQTTTDHEFQRSSYYFSKQ